MAKLRTGDLAPDFTLDGTDGEFTLSAHRGRRVALLFYPGDNTPVCTKQFCSYRDRAEELGELDAVVVGISVKGKASKQRFAAAHGITVPLLADPGGEVCDAYGMRKFGLVQRGVVVVDEDGRVAHRKVNPLGLTYETVDDLREALDAVAVQR